MQVTLVDRADLSDRWPAIAETLWPAVRQNPTYSLAALRSGLENGSSILFELSDGAEGLWVVSVGMDGPDLVAWTTAIGGRISGGPKARLTIIRACLTAIENAARLAGCKWHRICGRDYSRLFPEYTPYEGARNGLERAL